MHCPRVSVLLPAWNAAANLPLALDSLLAQRLGDFEVLAVDDGSTDRTPDILREYARRDVRIRPLHIPHGGIVAALNTGLAEARGEYVARMDADDLCAPLRLERQAALLDARPDLGLASCLVAFGGDRASRGGYGHYVDWINSLVSHEDIFLHRFAESPLAHPSVMFRRALAERLGGYRQGPFPEDYDLWLRWLAAGVRMEKVPEFLLTWNDPPDRLSRTHASYGVEAFYRLKSRALAEWLTATGRREVVVWGAGRVTRRRAGLLLEHGLDIRAWVDIDPAKIGQSYDGRPVWSPEDLPGSGTCFVLSYVASRGARELIRARLEATGHVLGRDFLPAA